MGKHERASDSQSLPYSQTVSRRTVHTPCASPRLPTWKVLYPVSRLQTMEKHERASDSQSLSHILKPSHAARLIPRARRQVPYETPHLQGPVRSAVARRTMRKIRASQRFSNCLIFSNRLTPDSSYPVRVANSPTKLPTCKVLYPVHRLQNLRKTRASRLIRKYERSSSHILKPSHAARLMLRARRQDSLPGRSCTQGVACKPWKNTSEPVILKPSHFLKPSHRLLYAVHRPQNLRKIRAIKRWRGRHPLLRRRSSFVDEYRTLA